MTDILTFRVTGRPAPQGSHRVVTGKNGRGRLIEQSPHVEPWRQTVAAFAREALGYADGFIWPARGPVEITIDVEVAQAVSNTDREPTGRNTGDIDKHARAVLDALVRARVLDDDSIVVSLTVNKRWARAGRMPGAFITVRPLSAQQPALIPSTEVTPA